MTTENSVAAQARIAAIDQTLKDTPISDPRLDRAALVDEKLALAAVVYATPPPLPPSGSSPAEVRGAIRGQAQVLRDLQQIPEGDPLRSTLLAEFVSHSKVRHAATNVSSVETNLSFDVSQPPHVPTPQAPPPELGRLPALKRSTPWPLAALEEAEAAATAEGIGDSFLSTMHLVRHAHDSGRRWTAEAAIAHWTAKYGQARAQELAAKADALDVAILSKAPRWRAWLAAEGVLYAPEPIEHAIMARERAKDADQ